MSHPNAPHDPAHPAARRPMVPLWAVFAGILVLQAIVLGLGWKLLS